MTPIRSAYSLWPMYNARLRDAVGALTGDQVLLTAGPGGWPLWAVVGHLACQRVFGLCDFAGEPGVETTPFPNAAYNCPGDDDLENVLGPAALAEALDSTFAIVDRCLDTWTLETLDQEIRREWPSETRVSTRAKLMHRTFAHDVSHITEANDILARAGLPQVDIWNHP